MGERHSFHPQHAPGPLQGLEILAENSYPSFLFFTFSSHEIIQGAGGWVDRPPGPEKLFQKPSVQATPGQAPWCDCSPFPVTQVCRMCPDPLGSADAMAPGFREHSVLTQQVVGRTHAVSTAPQRQQNSTELPALLSERKSRWVCLKYSHYSQLTFMFPK